ncbi:MAG: T9SS type A sorting domain-containing protein [Bacteroidales bacterium]|nr:T9SS type A sorting domain-containing protein [Bacteroidales bacterium]
MKIRALILSVFMLWRLFSAAQVFSPDVVSSSGDFVQSSGYSIQWNLGELAILTLYSNDFTITQGFGQFDLISTDITPPGLHPGNVNVFPNPTAGWLQVRFHEEGGVARLLLYDLWGKLHMEQQTEGPDTSLNLYGLPPGVYFLHVIQNARNTATYKIVKK